MGADPGRQGDLLVSIIVNNYNYDRFLAAAIDSALVQTYPHTEVVVVDDGSTDASRAIVASYGDRVVSVLKENGGQASAFNAGWARSQGDIVIFLDADDTLMPHIADQIVRTFKTQPQTAKVQYRLRVTDAGGRPTGDEVPPRRTRMLSGDLRAQVLSFPDDIPYPPTSGNAFAAWVLRRIFPVPEDAYRICADYYVCNLASLLGPVVTLDEPGGSYRSHGRNRHYTTSLDLETTRRILTLSDRTHGYLRRFARAVGGLGAECPTTVLSVTLLAHRLVSFKIERPHHPFPDDTAFSLVVMGIKASIGRTDLSLPGRCARALWFITMAVAPKPAARWLADVWRHRGVA